MVRMTGYVSRSLEQKTEPMDVVPEKIECQKTTDGVVVDAEKPRLGIADFLILTTSICIFFAIAEQGGRPWKWEVFLKSNFAINHGIAFGGLVICFIHWIKTKRAFAQPGYVLWLFSGLISLSFLIIWIFDLTPSIVKGLRPQAAYVLFTMNVLASVVTAVVLLFGFSKERWWWRVTYFSLLALCVLTTTFFLQHLFQRYYLIGLLGVSVFGVTHLVAILIIISVVCDFRVGLKRDWIHFAGIIAFLLVTEISRLTMMILSKYVPMRELYDRG